MKNLNSTLLILPLLLLSSCGESQSHEGLSVYTSFFPIYDFTSKILGEKGTVTNLTKAGVEPHDYDLTTQDVRGISEADLLIINGLNLEPYQNSLPSEISKKTYIASDGIPTVNVGSSVDPHVWLSLKNAVKMMGNIEKKLSEIDPDSASYYESNLNKYTLLFESVDDKIAETVESFSTKYIVTAHEAFSYFCNDYGLTQIAISGLSPEVEPTAEKIIEIKQAVEDYHITTIFYEELTSPATAQYIARETGCVTDVLSPLEGASDGSDDYLSIQSANLLALKKACIQ